MEYVEHWQQLTISPLQSLWAWQAGDELLVRRHFFFFFFSTWCSIGNLLEMIHVLLLMYKSSVIHGHHFTSTIFCNKFNSLAPGKFEWNFKYVIFQGNLMIDGWGIACELTLRWMSLNLTDDKSTLVQVMALCRQAPSHYLSQCWPRSMSPYDVTRPQWV